MVVDTHPQAAERLDDLDGDRARLRVHPFHAQAARGTNVVLAAVADHRERRVDDVQVRIDAHRGGEEVLAVAGVAVEEVAVVEVAIRAGIGDRLRRLVDRVIVGLG